MVAAGPTKPEAYVAYLKSRYFVQNQRSAEGVKKSLEYSLQAVQIDPDWALAYAGLAGSYISANYLDALPPQQVWPKAKSAAQKAVQLDPNLSEAHVALGEVLQNSDFDYPAAEREFKRAIELSPSNSHAHQSYADFLASLGRANEALSEIKLAQQLDPMCFWVSRDVGRMFYEARLYDQAVAALREASEMNPASPVVYNWLSWTYDKKGMIQESVEMDLKDEAANGASQEVLSQLRDAFEKSGQKGYLRKKLEVTQGDGYILAQINARLGNRDQAFRCLNQAFEQRSGYLALLKVDPELDNLRSDPRFQTHLHRMNLLK
jgi:tetratricopeptide (TPR) repeat protein